MIRVVIPTLNEAEMLPALLEDLRKLATVLPLDVVVVDGGSSDGTQARAAAVGARVLQAPRGRARQLNRGARAASGGVRDASRSFHTDWHARPSHREGSVRS
jgi:glycosyltransferase involved in cell wall biosynthesis